jgi:hypothetical protein
MPNQAHSGWRGVPWHSCDRCGTLVRTSDLVKQGGFLFCTTMGCADPESALAYNTRIERQKESVLADRPDAPLAPILAEDRNDEDEYL